MGGLTDWRLRGDGTRPPGLRVIEIVDPCFGQGNVLFRLLVMREHAVSPEGESISLRYFELEAGSGGLVAHPFTGRYSRSADGTESVSLTGGSVGLGAAYLRGNRLGTYLQDEIVRWARQWPQAIVQPIVLSDTDAYDENKSRRNRYYEQFGITFDYSGPECSSGASRPVLAGALTPVSSDVWQKSIKEYDLIDYLRRYSAEKIKLLRDIQKLHANLDFQQQVIRDSQSRPFRWAMRHFAHRHPYAAPSVLALSSLMLLLWAAV
ncbi:hypothetical protein [Pusillimonas minor]|uniref:Uncharacterized protein n=1 Tax=Pusillimonas minor TaxID=2697024 RepID=A0A842HPL5_9BURK|nr:hypothetical protein [Pusillimonas minor]MBC2770213.1 hypothetical protein [Pusillimonas minor]